MDYLLTAIVIALVCLAGWLLYKRWVGRYRQAPVTETEVEEEEEEETTALPDKPKVDMEPIPEPGIKEE